MIRLDSNHSINRGCIPFRFQAMWLSHPNFATVIRDSWNSCTDHAAQKTANLLCIAPNPFLNQLDLELSGEYNLLIDQEELFWKQKSRNSWLKEGDYNLTPKLFPKLLEADLDGLSSDVTNEEIHQNLFSIDSSSVWRGVLYGSKVLEHGIRWRIGSGDDVLFWTDNWLSCGVLRQWATIDLSEELLQTKVSDFLDNGVWDTTCLLACLPDNIVKLITGIHAGFNGSGVDKRIWQFTSDGCFSVKTAYSSLMEDNNLKWK
ncbi:hypothetical protein DKX38_015904 [Salix brachista]|uniref:Reverse transcriptase zinc-binding domain-containing protein n=1 Tax=Salix brachista TaxID=2182728 RepID=A0A5N5L8J5_9ROSI|nr:hypothetical protein DKX38_015904 [Salix brachista]